MSLSPLLIRSHHGTYAIMTIGKINNIDTIVDKIMNSSPTHFFELSGGEINATEAVAALINQKENLIEGIQYAQDIIDGSMSIVLFNPPRESMRPATSWDVPRFPSDARKVRTVSLLKDFPI